MRRIFTMLLVVSLVATALARESYHPQRDGLSLTYSNGETQTLSGPREFEGQEVMVLTRYYQGSPISEDYLSYQENGVFFVGTAAGGQTMRYDPPLQLYPAGQLQVGQSWESHSHINGLDITLSAEVLGIRGVETSAGRYNALQVRQITVTDTGARTAMDYFFVPSVGVVRFVTQDGSQIDLIEKNF